MGSVRQDALTGRWVILAVGRKGRPDEFAALRRRAPLGGLEAHLCPFCPGQESETPPGVLAVGRPSGAPADGPGWRVRAFPNKFPALRPVGAPVDPTDKWLPEIPGVGEHEVVVCGPAHAGSLGTLEPDLLAEILLVVRGRVRALEGGHPAVRHVLIFGNHGPDAGATLAHPHLQIIATPVVPIAVQEKVERLADHRNREGGCLLCEMARREEQDGSRLVAAAEHWVALAPFASRFPFEIRLIPRRHSVSLAEASDEELAALAPMLGGCIARLEGIAPHLSFNLVVHGAPVGPFREDFHWHLEILPRLSRQAGFEAGSGFAINSTPPEEAAAQLRFSVADERNRT